MSNREIRDHLDECLLKISEKTNTDGSRDLFTSRIEIQNKI